MSNLAASAGVANDRLSGATYQMSQLGDTLTLLDYTSIATATMNTEAWKNAMIETSKASGRMMDKFDGKAASNTAADYFEKSH